MLSIIARKTCLIEFKTSIILNFRNPNIKTCSEQVRIKRGAGGPDPPGKSHVIWVSIGNKQLDPPPPGKC